MKNLLIKTKQLICISLHKMIAVAVVFLAMPVYAQQSNIGLIDSARIPKPLPHFQPEYTFDKSADPVRWQQEKQGLQVSFASTDEALFKTKVPSHTNNTPNKNKEKITKITKKTQTNQTLKKTAKKHNTVQLIKKIKKFKKKKKKKKFFLKKIKKKKKKKLFFFYFF